MSIHWDRFLSAMVSLCLRSMPAASRLFLIIMKMEFHSGHSHNGRGIEIRPQKSILCKMLHAMLNRVMVRFILTLYNIAMVAREMQQHGCAQIPTGCRWDL